MRSPSALVVCAALLLACDVGSPSDGDLGDEHDLPGAEDVEADVVPQSDSGAYLDIWTGSNQEVNANLAAYLEGAGQGDRIRLSVYLFRLRAGTSSQLIYDALVGALARGATVELITEQKNSDNPTRGPEHRAFLLGLQSLGARVYVCKSGCVSDRATAINHYKVWLIDIDGRRTIVQSTANITPSTRFEAAAAVDGVRYNELWRFYSERLDLQKCYARSAHPTSCSIRGEATRITPHEEVLEWEGQGTIRAYQNSPAADRDYQLNVFKNITPGRGCRIRIVMGHWSDQSRGMAFVTELNRLHRGGCNVNTIYSGTIDPALKAAASFEIEHQSNVHAKFVAIDAVYYGKRTKIVWVGSANFTNGSGYHNDESIMRIKRDWAFDEFDRYFTEIERSE